MRSVTELLVSASLGGYDTGSFSMSVRATRERDAQTAYARISFEIA